MPPLTALEQLDTLIGEMGCTAWPQEHWRGEFIVFRHALANELQALIGRIDVLTTSFADLENEIDALTTERDALATERDMAVVRTDDDPQPAPARDDAMDTCTTDDDQA